MEAVIHNFKVEAGTTKTVVYSCRESVETPMDLNGWSARMQVRSAYNAPAVIASYDSNGNGLVISAAAGEITLTMAPADTNPIRAPKDGRDLPYDLEIFDNSGVVYRPFKGVITVLPQITITE